IRGAAAVDVQPAGELQAMDFRLTEQPTFRVRGRVFDSISGQIPTRGVSIGIVPRDGVVNTGFSSSSSLYNTATGEFELRDVPSGSYTVRAQLPLTTRPDPNQPFVQPPVAMAGVDVAGADVDGVVLKFVPPVSVSGRVGIDGESVTGNALRVNIALR